MSTCWLPPLSSNPRVYVHDLLYALRSHYGIQLPRDTWDTLSDVLLVAIEEIAASPVVITNADLEDAKSELEDVTKDLEDARSDIDFLENKIDGLEVELQVAEDEADRLERKVIEFERQIKLSESRPSGQQGTKPP